MSGQRSVISNSDGQRGTSMTCEKCWADAYLISRFISGKPQADEYRRLLEERKDSPCSPLEQSGRYHEDSRFS